MRGGPSRRGLLAGALASMLAGEPAAAAGDMVEPGMRLKARSVGAPTVALTLDACPGGFDTRIAEALVKHAVPATIFVTGSWIRRHPEGVAFLKEHPEIIALENHGDRHVPPVLGSRQIFDIQSAGTLAAIEHEVRTGAADVKALSGADPLWYRAATGFYSPAAREAIEGWGFAIGAYSLNADEGASLPAKAVASRIAAAADGDVIVAHVNQPTRPSGQGVVEGIEALSVRGVKFVRLDRLTQADVEYQAAPAKA